MNSGLSNRRRKEIGKLSQKKYRRRFHQMLVEGIRSIEAVLDAGAPLVEVLVDEKMRADERVEAVLARAEVPVHIVPRPTLERISDVQTSQGVLAVVRIERFPEEQLPTLHSLLVLDGVQDPGNVGTMIRTAAWFGVDGMLGSPGTAGFFHPKVVRAAMGGHWDLRLTRTSDLPSVLRRLQEAGWMLYGAATEGTSVRDWSPRAPSALVLGSEAHGLGEAVQAIVDEQVVIPGASRRRGTESLNVAISAGILLYTWMDI